MNKNEKFLNFLDKVSTEKSKSLTEGIKEAYKVIFECEDTAPVSAPAPLQEGLGTNVGALLLVLMSAIPGFSDEDKNSVKMASPEKQESIFQAIQGKLKGAGINAESLKSELETSSTSNPNGDRESPELAGLKQTTQVAPYEKPDYSSFAKPQ